MGGVNKPLPVIGHCFNTQLEEGHPHRAGPQPGESLQAVLKTIDQVVAELSRGNTFEDLL